MNLGQAVAVCLYELARDAKTASAPEKLRAASAGDLERLTSLLLEALSASGYLQARGQSSAKTRPAAAAEEKIRRFVRRMNPSFEDAELLLGMLRQIRWKLEKTSGGDREEARRL